MNDYSKITALYSRLSVGDEDRDGGESGKTTIPTKTWKTEYDKLTAGRKTLNQRYLALKEEVKKAEKIRKNVYGILRQEQREQQPRRKQDMGR